jgi:hypothetical protein
MEKNKETLKNAVGRLPQYLPEDAVWEGLEAILKQEDQLRRAIRELPAYAPSGVVWDSIQTELDRKPASRRLRMLSSWRIPAAAAALLLLFLGYRFFSADIPQTELVYSTETVDLSLFAYDWDQDEPAILDLLTFAKESLLAKNDPLFHSLLKELEELDEAKSEVKTMIDRYGIDGELVLKLSKIERERTSIIKEMAAFI